MRSSLSTRGACIARRGIIWLRRERGGGSCRRYGPLFRRCRCPRAAVAQLFVNPAAAQEHSFGLRDELMLVERPVVGTANRVGKFSSVQQNLRGFERFIASAHFGGNVFLAILVCQRATPGRRESGLGPANQCPSRMISRMSNSSRCRSSVACSVEYTRELIPTQTSRSAALAS